MGEGTKNAAAIDRADGGTGQYAELIDNMKDQMLVVLLNRLADANGCVTIPVAELDGTAKFYVLMGIDVEQQEFRFSVRRNQ